MLKWTSESEYFLSFEFFFADTIYISYIIQSKSNHAAHARGGGGGGGGGGNEAGSMVLKINGAKN